ncbi:glycosyltransferase [Aquicoccus sp. SCR17]|nr:glycosyltransferase [Carideicomes alvinocaridis]
MRVEPMQQDDPLEILRSCPEFDRGWYADQYADVAHSGLTPEEHYLRIGFLLNRDPGPDFSTRDYLDRHPDAREAGVNPLLHKHRQIARPPVVGAKPGPALRRPSRTAFPDLRTCAIFAAYAADGKVPDYTLHYLVGLAEIADRIVVVYDNDLPEEEANRLRPLCDDLIAARHGEYDFGSYKRGLVYARDRLALESYDHLLLCNDSCYGPLTSFAPSFREMCSRSVDFWGLTSNATFQPHIQSFFVCFSRQMFLREDFFAFFEAVEKKPDVSQVVLTYEVPMTGHFEALGFTWDTLINKNTPGLERTTRMDPNVTMFPLYMARNGCELIKVKALKKVEVNYDGLNRTLLYLRRTNAELFRAATEHAGVAIDPRVFQVAISLICPFHNRAHLIGRAIESVLEQNMANVELVLVDDGSTDGGYDRILENYAEEIERGLLVPIRLPRKSGVSAARNIGLSLAKHRWIGYLDSDNMLAPSYLESFALAILGNPAARCHYGVMRDMTTRKMVGALDFDATKMAEGNYIDLGGFLHHYTLLATQGYFDRDLKRLVDWDLILRFTSEKRPNWVRRIVGYYDETPTKGDRISTRESFSEARLKVRRKHGLQLGVTTLIPAYNHAATLRTAVLSALSQKGDFRHQIIIHDDCSTDETESVGRELQKSYPEQVIYSRPEKNLGVSRAYQRMFKLVDAHDDFTALLEGDDYWSDPEKLDRQMRFLTDNLDCAMVFSKVRVFDAAGGSYRTLKRQEEIRGNKVTPADFLAHPSHNLIGNFSSCLFRTAELKEMPEAMFSDGARINEIAVAFYFDRFGSIGYIDRPMSTYVQHPAGVWTGASQAEQLRSSIAARRLALHFAAPQYRARLEEIIAEREARLGRLSKVA